MKKVLLCLLSVVMVFSTVSCKKSSKKLVVASYSSFSDSWGKGRDIIAEFEKNAKVKVELLDLGSGFEFVNSLKKIKADVAVGIDDVHLDSFDGQVSNIKAFDFGFYSFVFDTRSGINPPKKLKDLIKPEYKGKYIIIDPRTSFVGYGLLRWAVAAFGEDEGLKFFKELCDNALTVSPSWTTAYSLFTNGEAPLVLSYSTSPVYHYDNDENHFTSLIFEEGSIETREYAFVFNNSKNVTLAKELVDYIVSNTLDIAVSNVMYPVGVNRDSLPKNYLKVDFPSKVLETSKDNELLEKWAKIML